MENKRMILSTIELLTLSSLILATLIFCKSILKNKRSKTTTPPLPPGPTAYPILGCLPQMINNKPAFRWIHKTMQELDTEIACFRLGNTHVIPVTSPELSREFLKKHDALFASRPVYMTAKLTSNGYLSAIIAPLGDQWKKIRRVLASHVLSPAMHRRLHVDKRQEEADHLVRYVFNQLRQTNHDDQIHGLVNMRVAARHYCGNVVRNMVFGTRFFGRGMEDGGPGVEEREHVDGVFTILLHLYGFAIADFVPWSDFFDFDGYRKILTNATNNVRKYQDPEISKRVEMWQNGMREKEDDILDILINLKDSENKPLLSIQEIQAQITELMIATVDNPSNAVEWAIAEMINQPEILKKACLELDKVVGRDRLVQESDLPNLNYVKACVKEAFRLHPIAPFNVPHVSTKDTIVGGYFIPKGSHVMLSRPGLGRNPKAWDDPLQYKPERHIVDHDSEVMLVDPDLRMLSFSTGRRGCPGVLLGSTITTMLLARLVQGFNWAAPPMVDLVESAEDLLLAKPLTLRGVPRLEPQVYMKLFE